MADDPKKKKKTPSIRRPAHRVLPVEAAIDVNDLAVETEKLNEIANLVRLSAGLDESTKNARIARAIELYESVKPQSGLEGMLATQMVGTHLAALECLRRAMVEQQTFAGREMNLKQAQKLMELYQRQLAALDKHRGKGQQKVTVEHVHVESGAQAIVGNVETGQRGGEGAPQPERLDQQEPIPAEFDRESKEAGRGKTRSTKGRKT